MVPQPSRRHFLNAGMLPLALGLGNFLRLRALASPPRPVAADSCVLIFLNGGMSHLDTFDPKPDQPPEIRGEFKTIRTSVPGILVGEYLPRMAKLAHLWTVLRTVGFEGRLGNHSPACYYMLTGEEPMGEAAVLAPPQRTDQPTFGSVAARCGPTPGAVPPFVMVPDVLIENAFLTPGQFGGWLGGRYDAFCLRADPSRKDFAVPALARPAELTEGRLDHRRALLDGLNARRPDLASATAGREMAPHYERAFELLRGGRAQAAFDLAAEPPATRDRYGRDTFGQSVLLARRLVEAGVRFVNVHWPNLGGGRNWDTHRNGFERLKNDLLPPFDCALSALLEDLQARGLLPRTLVAVLTAFGRAPPAGRPIMNSRGPGGRDHWSSCFSIVLAGGGVRGGQVVGRSDARGSFPAEQPLTPADVAATILHALGIDPSATLPDGQGRERRLCDGRPIASCLE